MKIRHFEKKDLQKLTLQPEQKAEFNPEDFGQQNLFTMLSGDEVVCIFGFYEIYKGRAAAFSFVNQTCGKVMAGMVKKLKKVIETGMTRTGTQRLEITVLDGFSAGERMATLLGFEHEGLMKCYFKGRDYQLYARVMR